MTQDRNLGKEPRTKEEILRDIEIQKELKRLCIKSWNDYCATLPIVPCEANRNTHKASMKRYEDEIAELEEELRDPVAYSKKRNCILEVEQDIVNYNKSCTGGKIKTREDILSDVSSSENRLTGFRPTSGRNFTKEELEKLEELDNKYRQAKKELEEYDRDPIAYFEKQKRDYQKIQKRRIEQEFVDREKAIKSHIDSYEKDVERYRSKIEYERRMGFPDSRYKIEVYEREMKRCQDNLASSEKSLENFRIEKYWATHQQEKNNIESEKQSLTEQIAALNKEISEIPEKTEGYSDMVEFQKKNQNLIAEKKALGFFKFKDKKAIQARIDSNNNEITKIQARINSAIEAVKERITLLKNRINAIDTELTRQR